MIKTIEIENLNAIKQNLARSNCVLINNAILADDELESFVKQLGEPLIEARNINGQSIFNVRSEKRDGYFSSYANSNHYFALHTDCFSVSKIPNCVLLLCKSICDKGGETLLVEINRLIPFLPEHLVSYLMEKTWNISNEKRSILRLNSSEYKVFYNRTHIELANHLSPYDIAMLDCFDIIADRHKIKFKLIPDQMIIFRNDNFLHGRTDFEIDSNRLLKRVRFNIS